MHTAAGAAQEVPSPILQTGVMSSTGGSPAPRRANGNGLLAECTASQDAELEMSEVRLINEDETMPFNESNLDSVLSNPDYARHRQALAQEVP